MAGEARSWENLRPHMVGLKMDPVRVENPALPGTPDVNFIEGWTELKAALRWPPKGGPLQLDHPPTQEQKVWLLRRWTAGGWATLTLKVGEKHNQTWMVFRGCDVIDLWREAPMRDALEQAALLVTSSPRDVAELLWNGRLGE